MKVCVFGCKYTTKELCEFLNNNFIDFELVTIAPDHQQVHTVAGYKDLTKVTKNTKVHKAEKYSLKSDIDLEYFEGKNFDIGLVLGWQRLIPSSILNTFSRGVFGMHGSSQNLPKGRGRSPMNWALVEDRIAFSTNMFKYESGIDNGPVVDTIIFSINKEDDAYSLHYKNMLAFFSLIKKNLQAIFDGNVELKSQNSIGATYYPKRSPADSQIDFKKDITKLHCFIRAVSRPFGGAFSYIDSKLVNIYSANIFTTDTEDLNFISAVVGEVIHIDSRNGLVIKVIGGTLLIRDWKANFQINIGDIFKTKYTELKYFPINELGNYDIE